jgi:hypothetical protein
MLRLILVAVAVAAAVVPIPARFVERYYSSGIYPVWQSWMRPRRTPCRSPCSTCSSSWSPAAWLILAVNDVRRLAGRAGLGRACETHRRAARPSGRPSSYLVFLASWGLNYRAHATRRQARVRCARVLRGPRFATLGVDGGFAAERAAPSRSHEHRDGRMSLAVDPAVAVGVRPRRSAISAPRALAVPGATESTRFLNLYFRRAVVDGMTDPMFLETLVVSDLLPFERPIVTAHEWAHLAGYNDEGEANFVGWLSCMRGDAPRQYSAWIFLYSEAASQLPRGDRQQLGQRLDAGPRDDLRAIADRVAQNRSARVSQVGWQVYNQYLQANRVESGTASYGEVIRLILGTRFNPSGPTLSP